MESARSSAVWGGTTVITPDADSIANIRVVTNDYDAEIGRFSGAQTMVTSKSGTNQIHGSLFFGLHRPGLNAYQRLQWTAAIHRETMRASTSMVAASGGLSGRTRYLRSLPMRHRPKFDYHRNGLV